jgi:acyl-CoA hydrolase
MEILNTHPIKKSDLGFHGNLFGGKLLAWLERCCSWVRYANVRYSANGDSFNR